MSLPDTPAHDRESPASGATPPGGEAEPRALSAGGKEHASGSAPPWNGKKVPRIGKFDGDSLVFGTKPAGRSDWAELVSGETPPPTGGAGRLTRRLLLAYLLPLLTFGALTAGDPSRVTPQMLLPVCFGPACLVALWGLWSARREDNAGAAAHARALLISLLYGVDACLLWLLSLEADPGPAGPVESAGFAQVLMFIIEFPARLFSWLCEHTAFLLGCWIALRVGMGCTTLLGQKSPGWLIRHVMASFMMGAWLLGISLISLAILRGVL